MYQDFFVVHFLFLVMSTFILGPVEARFYSGNNWSNFKLAFVTNRNGGMARRETAIKGGFKSDHVTDMIGQDNPADTFEAPDGTLFFGKIVQTLSGVHTVSAKEVYTKSLYQKAVKQGLNEATTATQAIEQPAPEPAPVA